MPSPSKPPPRTPLRVETLASALQQRLESEPQILDLLFGALARGSTNDALWDQLHAAAARDERLPDLAFAYERFSNDRKLKSANAATQAAFLFHAGTFFADVFADPDGGEPYLVRALELAPGDPAIFQKLEALYAGKRARHKLGALYAAAAPHREGRAEPLSLLRRAAELLGDSHDVDQTIRVYQDIVKLDPADASARRELEERYDRAGRYGELAKLFEQSLAEAPAPPEDEAHARRLRLVALYAGLRELERALPHAEEVLRVDPSHAPSVAIATELLSHKAFAARAASTLASVHERLGEFDEAARMLGVEVEHLRGPRRVEAQKRLAALTYARLGDVARTFAIDEAVVPLDPADREVRARFIEAGTALGKLVDVARVLSRAVSAAKDPAARASVSADLGDVFLATGESRKARGAYQAALDARADDDATLRAARALATLSAEAKDPRALSAALACLAEVLPDPDERAEVALRLARIREDELRDPPGAIEAYRKLLGTSLEYEGAAALERYYEAAENYEGLAPVLEIRARAEPDRERAEQLAFRAAEIRSTKLEGRVAALEAWLAYVATFGPSRPALARLLPLLEQEKRWEELAVALDRDAALAAEAERAPILARLASIRLMRLGDAAGALGAIRVAIQIHPAERGSRAVLDKLLASSDQRLAAAAVLEPLARAEGAFGSLVRVLEARGALDEGTEARLAALAEASELSGRELRDPKRAIELAGRGLELAVDAEPSAVPAWIARVEELSSASGAAESGALALRRALGEREPSHPALGLLARRAGEALVRAGDVSGALEVFRRALAAEPSSPDLLARVDALLREQGSPSERIALYRTALEGAEDPRRRRELLHAIGAIERRDLGDRAAAVATYRRALAEDPGDRDALAALVELFEQSGEWEPLYEELRGASGRASGDERVAIGRRLAVLASARGWLARAAEHYRDLLAMDPDVRAEELAEIERVARAGDDVELLRAAFDRRLSLSEDSADAADWLERIGDLDERLERFDAAAAALRGAAEAALSAGDSGNAARLYERVLTAAPDDRGAAERLLALYREAGAWDRIPKVTAALIRTAKSAEDAARTLLASEPAAVRSGAIDPFVAQADALLARYRKELPEGIRASVRASRAAVISTDPGRRAQAVSAYRAILEAGEGDVAAAAQSFDALLRPLGAEAAEDLRWLFAFREAHALPASRVALLLAWAEAEEGPLGDPAAAAALYGRVLALDPEHDSALAARTRILLVQGDVAAALDLLSSRRERVEGGARDALEVEIAALLLDRLDRPAAALAALAAPLESEGPGGQALDLARRALARLAERASRPVSSRAAARGAEAEDAGEEGVEGADASASSRPPDLDWSASLVGAVEPIARVALSAHDPEVRAALIEALLALPIEHPSLRASRRGWYERLLEAPGLSPAEALDIALRAIDETPDDMSLWERAEVLARESHNEGRLAEAYRSALAAAGGEPAAYAAPPGLSAEAVEELGRRAVDYHEEWFDDQDAVVALLRRIVTLAPSSGWAFERLKLTYNLSERWQDLFSLYDEAIARAEDPAVRRDLLEDAALAAKDLAADPGRATRYFEELLALRDDPRIRAALERLYERHGNHRPLIALLSRQLPGLDGDAAQAQRIRIARLLLEGASDLTAAVETIQWVLETEPDRTDAYEILERVMAAASLEPRPPEVADARQRAAALLEAHYQQQGRSEDLARVLEITLEGEPSPARRAERLRALVDLRLSALGDEAGAFEAVASLVLLEPEFAPNREELARLAGRVRGEARQAEVLATAAAGAADGLRVELLSQAAAVYKDRLGEADQAILLYRAVLDEAEDRSPLALEAARELERFLTESGTPLERCDVLEVLAVIEPEASARRGARAELARLAWPAAGDADRAIRAYRAALAEDAADEDALAGLAGVLEELGRFRELIEILDLRAVSAESGEALRYRLRIAKIFDEELGEPTQAIAVYREARARFGRGDESAAALAALLEKTERWGELIALLEDEAGVAEDGARAADLWRRAGDLHRERTGRWAEAIAAYEQALEERSKDLGARQGLEQMVAIISASPEAPESLAALRVAVALLVRLYAASENGEATIALLEPRLFAARDDDERVVTLEETAALLERGADASAAFDALFRAFKLKPRVALAAEALRLVGAADRFPVLVAALAEGLAERPDVPVEVARDLYWSVALFHRDQRADYAAAEAAIDQALLRAPDSVPMLEALADVQRRSPSRSLCATLVRIAERSVRATGAGLDAYREAVAVAEEKISDPEFARDLAEKLLEAAVLAWPGAVEAQPSRGRAEMTSQRPPPGGSSPPMSKAALAALFAIDVLVRLSADAGPEPVIAVLLRGARLPFDAETRRKLRLRAAEFAPTEQKVAIYEELFGEDPHDALAADRLDALYREHQQRAALIRLRERQIATTRELDRRVMLRYDFAGLLVEAGEIERAIEVLRENLSVTPSHPPSIIKLAEMLEAAGHFQELIVLCEDEAAEAETAGDRDRAADLWEKAATLAETRVGNAIRAITSHRRAAALGSLGAADALSRLLVQRGEYAAGAEVLERLCERAAPEALHTLALRLTDAYLAAGNAAAARARLERFIPLAPRGGDALRDKLASLYREAGDYGPLAALVAESAARGGDPRARAGRLREAADIYLTHQRDAARAVPLLEQAAQLVPEDTTLRRELAAALNAAGRRADAATVLSTLIASYGTRRPKDRALVHYELAKVLAPTDRSRAAAELDLALRIDPAHPEILAMLARISMEDGQLDRAARTYRALLLIVRKPREEGLGLGRAEVFLELGEISKLQGDAGRAAEYLESAFESARESPEESERLLVVLRRRGSHEMLARALEAKLAAAEGALAAPILDELAALYDERLSRSSDALDARLRAFALAPPAPEAVSSALDIAARIGELPRFIAAVSSLAAREADTPRGGELFLALGRAEEREGRDLRRAAEAYVAAEARFGGDPTDPRLVEVFLAQGRIYAALGDDDATAALLEKQIAHAAEPGGAADALYRLAALRLTRGSVRELEDGVVLLDRALAADPQPDRAEVTLRNGLVTSPGSAPILRALERLAREAPGRERTLVDALVMRWDADEAAAARLDGAPGEVRAEASDPARFEALKEAAQLAQQIGDEALFDGVLGRALKESPPEGDFAVTWALTALAARRAEQGNLAEAAALKERAARASGPAEERELLLEVALLSAGPLADLPRAARIFEELRAREPAEREIWQPLAEVYRNMGDRARLGALLDETAPLLDSPAERTHLRIEGARMAMADNEKKAIELLQDIIAESPAEAEPAALLADLLEKHGLRAELAELLGKQIDAAKDRQDTAMIATLSMRLGSILEQEWDEQGAVDVYYAALDWAPKSRDILRAIVRLGGAREDSLDLGDVLDRLLEVEEGDEAVDLALRLARIRSGGGDGEGALRALERGYAVSPRSAALREELTRLYAASEAWGKLAMMHVRDADARASKEGKIEGFSTAAEILREHGDPAGAAEILARALDVDLSDRDILLALVNALSAIGEQPRAIAAIGKALEASPDDPWLYRARASLYEAIGDARLARADLEAAYAHGGGGYARELAAALDREAREAISAGNPDARPIRLRLAEVLAVAGDVDRARAELTELAREGGKDREALQALAAIEEFQGIWDAAIATYRRLIPLEEGDALIAVALKLADACQRGGRMGDARSALERALSQRAQASSLSAARERLREVYAETGAHRELADMFLEDAAATPSFEARLPLVLHAARLLLETGGEAARAAEVLEETRAQRTSAEGEHEIVLLLAAARASAGYVDAGRALLDEAAAAHKGRRSKQLSAIYRQRARVELTAGDNAAALAALGKALEADPQNGALAMELGLLAVELDDQDVQSRAFRTVTMMKIAHAPGGDGTSAVARGLAYYYLGCIAVAQGDRRKARLMIEKAVVDDPSLEAARVLLEQLRAG
jgi:golgin subfamily B member 1